jgi:hypothetical protein
MKNSSDTIVNRTRDLPACSTVPQPTAPPRAPDEWQEWGLITLITRAMRSPPPQKKGYFSYFMNGKNEW